MAINTFRLAMGRIKRYIVLKTSRIVYRSLAKSVDLCGDRRVLINIGAGNRPISGWINTDMGYQFGLAKGIVIYDARKAFKLKDSCVDCIYCSHVLEHLENTTARSLLSECYRVLKPGGKLRLVVPDLEICVKKYIEKDESFFLDPIVAGHSEEEIDYYYRKNHYLTYTDLFLGVFYSSEFFRRYNAAYHRYVYDYDTLYSRLQLAGFSLVERGRWAHSGLPDIEEFEKEQGAMYSTFSLYVEARK